MSLTVSPITSHVGIARVWEWQVTRDGRTVRRCMTQADAEQQARSLLTAAAVAAVLYVSTALALAVALDRATPAPTATDDRGEL
jgi:hypothetical protein